MKKKAKITSEYDFFTCVTVPNRKIITFLNLKIRTLINSEFLLFFFIGSDWIGFDSFRFVSLVTNSLFLAPFIDLKVIITNITSNNTVFIDFCYSLKLLLCDFEFLLRTISSYFRHVTYIFVMHSKMLELQIRSKFDDEPE